MMNIASRSNCYSFFVRFLCQSLRVMIDRDNWISLALSLIRGVHICAKALLDINFMWFDYVARLSQWGRGGRFTPLNDFSLPLLRLEEGGAGGSAPCGQSHFNNLPLSDKLTAFSLLLQNRRDGDVLPWFFRRLPVSAGGPPASRQLLPHVRTTGLA